MRVVVIPNPNMQTPHFDVIRLRDDEISEDQSESFEIDLAGYAEATGTRPEEDTVVAPQALVRGVTPDAPPPAVEAKPQKTKRKPKQEVAAEPQKPGLITRLWAALFAPIPEAEEEKAEAKSGKAKNRRRSNTSNTPANKGNPLADVKQPAEEQETAPTATKSSEQPSSGAEADEAGENKRRRRRGRRGGRRRNGPDGRRCYNRGGS